MRPRRVRVQLQDSIECLSGSLRRRPAKNGKQVRIVWVLGERVLQAGNVLRRPGPDTRGRSLPLASPLPSNPAPRRQLCLVARGLPSPPCRKTGRRPSSILSLSLIPPRSVESTSSPEASPATDRLGLIRKGNEGR